MSFPEPADDETVHVIPLGDLREHIPFPYCWCRPVRDFQCEQVFVHNSADGRERTKH